MKNLIREGGKILTLRHMKIFTTVYRCGSVTRAAQELHLAQPSLSVAIRELEEHYGVQVDEDRYTVFYEAFAENLMPEITVVENEGA